MGTVPWAPDEVAPMVPPCAAMTPLVMRGPRLGLPDPPLSAGPRVGGSKTASISSGGIGAPLVADRHRPGRADEPDPDRRALEPVPDRAAGQVRGHPPDRALFHCPTRPPDVASSIARRGWAVRTSSMTCRATRPMFIVARTTGSPGPDRVHATSSRLPIRRARSSAMLMSIVWRSLSVPMRRPARPTA